MKRKLTFASFLLAAVTILLSTPAAYGDSLTFTLLTPSQMTLGGQAATLSFYATVSAPNSNTGTEYLNSASFVVGTPTTLDDSNFANFPYTLDPGQSYTDLLFTIFVPANIPFGDYSGSFTILGGSDNSSTDALAKASYDIGVTPEPSSFVLLATGLSLLTAAFWYRGRYCKTSLAA
jgi:hypothetical protein